ncbi:hypothetical protein TNCT1_68660 [Streptomyces sp. 1-11]|nr:hypothetical protein TNCT1_68660 [Streptomyces sp. 1-11]
MCHPVSPRVVVRKGRYHSVSCAGGSTATQVGRDTPRQPPLYQLIAADGSPFHRRQAAPVAPLRCLRNVLTAGSRIGGGSVRRAPEARMDTYDIAILGAGAGAKMI